MEQFTLVDPRTGQPVEVSRYRSIGLAVAAIRPGEKVPGYRGWTRRSLEPQDFCPGAQVGLMPGRLSGDLVCVDLDSPDALARADAFLPPTGMVEGRPGSAAATGTTG
jgi:hypothetical protein